MFRCCIAAMEAVAILAATMCVSMQNNNQNAPIQDEQLQKLPCAESTTGQHHVMKNQTPFLKNLYTHNYACVHVNVLQGYQKHKGICIHSSLFISNRMSNNSAIYQTIKVLQKALQNHFIILNFKND